MEMFWHKRAGEPRNEPLLFWQGLWSVHGTSAAYWSPLESIPEGDWKRGEGKFGNGKLSRREGDRWGTTFITVFREVQKAVWDLLRLLDDRQSDLHS
jgi:hypothetical protein